MASTSPAPTDFDPPRGYTFEPELMGPAPRPVPDNLKDGPYAREARTSIVRLAAIGLLCFALPYVPGIDELAYYLLPLGYLTWIGLAAVLIAAGAAVHYVLRRGRFLYVRHGMPLVARISDLDVAPSRLGHGQYAYTALLTYRHPQTGAVAQSRVKSPEIAPIRAHRYDPRLEVGDYVTAVYLPEKNLEKTLRLYAFLDVSPSVNIRTATSSAPLRTALAVLAIVTLLFVLFGNVYGMGRYMPLDMPIAHGVIAALLGVAAFGALMPFLPGTPPLRGATVRQKLGWAFYLLLFGSMSGVCWSFMVNAWLDHSPPRPQPATIVNTWAKTYNFIARSYEIEYRLGDSRDKHKLPTTLGHIEQFQCAHAVATLRDGAFGWEWVDSVDPAHTPSPEEIGGPEARRLPCLQFPT